jgi:hypothetical protein
MIPLLLHKGVRPEKAYICLKVYTCLGVPVKFELMKTRLAISALFLLAILIACSKDKFTTEPQVKVKSISPETVRQGDIIRMDAEFTDQEGDVDSVYIVYKWYEGDVAVRVDTFKNYTLQGLGLPPDTKEGDLQVTLSYGRQIDGIIQISPTPNIRDTTATLGLLLVDKAGHRSGYSESERIRLIKF